jgi:hypothetical protein
MVSNGRMRGTDRIKPTTTALETATGSAEQAAQPAGPQAVGDVWRVAGNRAVSRLIEGSAEGPAAGPGSAVSPMMMMPLLVQRQPAGAQQDAPEQAGSGVRVTMGSLQVSTYGELLAAGRLMAEQLRTDAAELPAGETARTAAEELIAQAKGWETTLSAKAAQPLDQAAVNQATVWTDAFRTASLDVDKWKKAKARADLQRALADADAARAALEALPDQLAELQRSAFLDNKPELLEKIVHVLAPTLQVTSALLEVHEQATEVVSWLGAETSHASELLEKVAPIAEKAHQLVAGFEAVSNGLILLSGGEGKTELDKSMSQVSAGFGLTSAVGALSGVGTAYMVYFGALLSAAQSCVAVIARLARSEIHQLNLLELSQGNYDQVDWSAEPGGRATFDFMLAVMKADDAEDIPGTIPSAVDELIVKNRESMTEGTGEEVPTTGFWFWRHTDRAKIREWLFANRRNVWNMLYGDFRPPG